LIFEKIPEDEEFKNVKLKIFKEIFGFLTEKKITFNYRTLIHENNTLDKITNKIKVENERRRTKKINVSKTEIELAKCFNREIEENGIEDLLIEKNSIKYNYFKKIIENLNITRIESYEHFFFF